jgi:hypothetical protein
MASVNVDVDIDDILYDMSSDELQSLVDDLYNDGYIPKQLSGGVSEHQKNIMDLEWDELIQKMSKLRLQLSNEDEETIRKILNKH